MTRKYKYKVLIKQFVYVDTDSEDVEFIKGEVQNLAPKLNYYGWHPDHGYFDVYSDDKCSIGHVLGPIDNE